MNEPNYYAVLPADVRYDEDLTMGARLLYGELTALSNKNGYAWASNEYFANLYKVSNRTISNWLSRLEKKGYINRKVIYKENSKAIKERRIYITPRKYIHGGGENNFMGGGENNFLDNNTSINITSINSIYAFWNTQKIINHRKLTDKMKRKIKTTLKDYTEEEIKTAIKNYSEIVNDDKYYFKYRWTIDEFLQRGLERFIDGEIAKQNYLDESKVDKKEQNKEEHNPYKHMKIYE